jgi:hypothetical protein
VHVPDTRWTTRRHRRTILLALLAALVVALVVVVLICVLRPRWHRVWGDDFDGRAGRPPSTRNWLMDTGTSYPGGAPQWGTGELERYTADPANVALDGAGRLRITSLRDTAGGWTSARLETRRADFQPPRGGQLKVEARIKLPAGGPGYWSAFWMLGAPFRPQHTDWPGAGELDVMENIGTERFTVHGTFHCGVVNGGPCRELSGLAGSGSSDGRPFSEAFHDFTMIWDRTRAVEQLRWYVDGRQYHTVQSTDVDRRTWDRATGHGFFLLLNVAIGGGWPGAPTEATHSGASMLVDRVTVSTRG